jgi:catechol 2,3-dioxygenase-like lactoylglutathione lyase family enzyme
MPGTTLMHIGIAATELERSVRFGRDAIGPWDAGRFEDCQDLTDGYLNFRLFQHRGGDRPANVAGPAAYHHLGVRVDDLQAALRRFTELGFEIGWDDVDDPTPYDPVSPPTRSFRFEDPDGNVLDVTASDDQWPGIGLR